MSDVEDIMDLAIAAAEDTFSLTVTYVAPDGSAPVTFPADYQRTAKTVGFDNAEVSSFDPRLDVRKASLLDRGLDVRQGGLVSFVSEGESLSFEILDVSPTAVGTLVLQLGRRP